MYLHPSWDTTPFPKIQQETACLFSLCIFTLLLLKVGQDFGGNAQVQIQVEIKGDKLTACHKNPGGVALEHGENKGMRFHVLLASPMYWRLHFSALCGTTPALLRSFCFSFFSRKDSNIWGCVGSRVWVCFLWKLKSVYPTTSNQTASFRKAWVGAFP